MLGNGHSFRTCFGFAIVITGMANFLQWAWQWMRYDRVALKFVYTEIFGTVGNNNF